MKTESTQTPHSESVLSPDEIAEGFVSLFDGETLDGWQGDTKHYLAEDGNLVSAFGGGPHRGDGGHLFTTRQFDDFVLRFEYKLTTPGANSDIVIRTPLTEKPSTDGLAIQILDDVAYPNLQPWMLNGSIPGVATARNGTPRPLGQWNSMQIVAHGPHVTVQLNGRPVVDVDLRQVAENRPPSEPDPTVAALRRTAGLIGLKGNVSQGRVDYRNIRIKEIAEPSNSAGSESAYSGKSPSESVSN